MAVIEVDSVTKRFPDGTVAVDSADFTIADGEFFILVGPSGCGKSTLLNMIVGLEDISEGTLKIGDRVVNDLDPKDRNLAMVFQNYALYPHLTVRENMAFPLRLKKVPNEEVTRRVDEAARILELTELLDRKPAAMSGGQRQRVAMGRAIVREPAVFLMDEPLSNLDAKLRVQTRAEIARIHQRLGTTTVYVTHDQVEAMTMGHRIAIMNAGILQQVGTPLEVYERPENVFVANFIGTPPMNFLRCTVGDGGARLTSNGLALPAPEAARAVLAGRDGQPIIVGVRPENVVAEGSTRGATAPVELTADLVETLGHEVLVHGRKDDHVMVFKMDAHQTPGTGDSLKVLVEVDKLHLFDATSEKRITN